MNARVKDRLLSQQALLEDVDPGLRDYVQALVSEGQYRAAAKLWRRLNYCKLAESQCKGCLAYRALVVTMQEGRAGAEESADEIEEMVE